MLNPKSKHDFKSFIIHLEHASSFILRSLKAILEQLCKKVVCFNSEFDVGYMMGTQKICFGETDDIAVELWKIVNKGYSLWFEGDDSRKRSISTGVIDEKEEDEEVNEVQEKRAAKSKKPKVSALQERPKSLQ